MTTVSAFRRAAAARVATVLLAGAAVFALAACEQRAEPHPAYESAQAPPPAPLAGAPEGAPTAAPPFGSDAPAPQPAPSLVPSDAAPSEAAQSDGAGGEGLVAMAPIPNPEDGGPVPPRPASFQTERNVERRYDRGYEVMPLRPLAHRRRHRRHHWTAHAWAAEGASAPRPHPVAATHPPRAAHPAPAPRRRVPTAQPAARHERRATPSELRGSAPTRGSTTAAASTADASTAAARVEALRSALSGALARGAVLTIPKATADQAVEVGLTAPADFYDTLKREAGRQGMADAAASANLEATLSGDGYAVIPGGAQSQPIRAGQPTTLRWTVTAPAGAKGPLRADVNADLLGGGTQRLALGVVDPAGAGVAPRWWGAALLAAVIAVGLGWLLRSRSADARIAASRRRNRRPDGVVGEPRAFDIGAREADRR